MKFPIRQPNFSGGMRGPRGQFREDNQNSFVHAENFIVDRDGSLRNRPALLTAPSEIPLLDTDNVLRIEANDTTYTLVYDPLLFIEWGETSLRLPFTLTPGNLDDQNELVKAYADDEFVLNAPIGNTVIQNLITQELALFRGVPGLSLLKDIRVVRSQYGLGLNTNSLEDYNTWLQLGYTDESIAENYNKVVNYSTQRYLFRLLPKTLDTSVVTSADYINRVRRAGRGVYQTLIQLYRGLSLVQVQKSSLFWNRFLLYNENGDIISHFIHRYMFSDENTDYEGTPETQVYPDGDDILSAREAIYAAHPEWQKLEYQAAPPGGRHVVLTERTGRLPTLLIDFENAGTPQEQASIFDMRILHTGLYEGPSNTQNGRGVKIFPSYITAAEAEKINFGTRSGNPPAPATSAVNFGSDVISSTVGAITTPADSRQAYGAAANPPQPSGNALVSNDTVESSNTGIPNVSGMKLQASPVIKADAAYIKLTGGVAISPFFNGRPLIRWITLRMFADLYAALPTGTPLRERNNLVRDYPIYSTSPGSLTSMSSGSGEIITPRTISALQYSALTYMNPAYNMQKVQFPIHGEPRRQQSLHYSRHCFQVFLEAAQWLIGEGTLELQQVLLEVQQTYFLLQVAQFLSRMLMATIAITIEEGHFGFLLL